MVLSDIIGASGVTLILLAYFLNVAKVLQSHSTVFLVLNGIGSLLACWSSYLIGSVPFMVLEGAWAFISFTALIRTRPDTNN